MSKWLKYFLCVLGAVVLLGVVVAFFRPSGSSATGETKPISTLIEDAKANRVSQIEVTGSLLKVTKTDQTTYHTRKEVNTSIFDMLKDNGIDASSLQIEVRGASLSGLNAVFVVMPLIILLGVIGFLSYQLGKARGRYEARREAV